MKSIKMMKATFINLFAFLILITTINGKPFYRPMPGLIHQTLNRILTKQINEKFSTKSIVEPTNTPILLPSESKLTSATSNPLNKILTIQTNKNSFTKSTIEQIRLPILVSKSKSELRSTISNPLEERKKSKILKTEKLPIVVIQSKSGFQLLTQLTESRKFKSTESTHNPLSACPKSKILQTKLPIILQSKSGFQTFQKFQELKPDPTSTPKTSPIRSTTKESQNDLPTTEPTKSELNSKKQQTIRAKSEQLSVPQARYKLMNPKRFKICYLQFFEKCSFDEWSRFLNSNKHMLSLFRLNF